MTENPSSKSTSLPEKLVYLTTLLSVLAFVFCYLFIGYFNRFSADDHSAIYSVKHFGFWQSNVDVYFRWEGSFFVCFLDHLLFELTQGLKSLLLIHFVTIVFLFASFFFLIRAAVKKIFSTNEDSFLFELKIFLLTGLLLSSLYCLCQDATQVWFWTTCIVSYLFPLAFLAIALGLTIEDKKMSFAVLAAIIFFLFGGTRVNYFLMVAAVYSLYIAYQLFILKRKVAIIHYTNLALLVLGGFLYIVAPGNYARRTTEINNAAETVHPGFVHEMISAGGTILNELIIKRTLYLLVLFSPAIVIGHSFRNAKTADFINTLKPGRIAIVGFGIFLFLLLINMGALYMAVKTADYPRRVYTPVALFYFGYVLFLLFILGLKTPRLGAPAYLFVALLMLITVGAYAKIVWKQYPVLKAYSKAIDTRFALIKTAQEQSYNQPILYLPVLPRRGILPINEIDTDTGMYINSDMRKRFHCNFAIAITDSTARPRIAHTGINEFTGYLKF